MINRGNRMLQQYGRVSFLLILLVAILFRFYGLELLPQWAWDEGVNANISWNLTNLKAQWFSLTYPFIPHPPLFFVISSILLKFFGNKLIIIRVLTAFYGALTAFIIYLIGKEAFGLKNAVIMSFLFSIHPWAIFFNRSAFANNQLMFFYILSLYFFLRYYTNKGDIYLYLSSISAVSGLLTEFTGVGILISILILCQFYKKCDGKKIFIISVISIMPLIIFLLIMLSIMPDAFIHDFIFTSNRFKNSIFGFAIITIILFIFGYCLKEQTLKILQNIMGFYRKIAYDAVTFDTDTSDEIKNERVKRNLMLTISLLSILLAFLSLNNLSRSAFFGSIDYFWFGITGFIFIERGDIRNIILLFFLPMFIITMGVGRLDHMIIPLYPFFSIGLAILLITIYDFLTSICRNVVVNLIIFVIIAYPFIFFIYQDFNTFVLQINPLVGRENIRDRIKVSNFINNRIHNDDIIIADSHFPRFIKGKVSVILQSVAIHGRGIMYMSSDYGNERFVFNCSYKNARFIVIKKNSLGWLKDCCNEILEHIRNYKRYEIGEYILYENYI